MNNKVVTTVVKSFVALGFPTLRFNFRGIGQSQGEYAFGRGEQQDTLAVLAWLENEQALTDIFLAGFSFGAFVALATAEQIATNHLLLIAPPVEYPEFSALKTPPTWSLITAANDEVVSTPAILKWATRQNAPQHFYNMPEASHFFHGKLATLQAFITEHFHDRA